MSHVFHRNLRATLPKAVSASGIHIVDQHGKQYIDACGGAAVSCLGHNHPSVLAAMQEQMHKLDYAHTSFFTTDVAEELAELMVANGPQNMRKVYMVSSGSEAIEAALKMARQYFLERGELKRTQFIARRQSYHGNTLGALAVGGNAWRREPFQPLLMDATHIAPCYAYRNQREGESAHGYGQRLVAELESEIVRLGPDTVIAVCMEPVVGATLGAVAAVEGYFQGVRRVCDKYGVLLIADEIMCGMGRTGTLYALEQEGIEADLITVAKGLGGGYQAIGAVLVSEKVANVFSSGSGQFMHGHTYIGHPVACAAALEVQKVLMREELVTHCAEMGPYLRDSLHQAFDANPFVGDIRGRGLFQAIELVQSREDKKPFDPRFKLNARIRDAAMDLGLMVYAMGGTIDGRLGDHILLAPPFTVSPAQVQEIVGKLQQAVQLATSSIPLSTAAV